MRKLIFSEKVETRIKDSNFTIKYLKGSRYKRSFKSYNRTFLISYLDLKIKVFEFTGDYKKPSNQFIIDCIKKEAIRGNRILKTDDCDLRSFIILKQSYLFISDIIDKLELQIFTRK